jgi:hypothetical protein
LKFGDSKNPRRQFPAGRSPTVAPQKDYLPVRSGRKPPFHAEIEAASNFPDNSPEFRTFVMEVVGMPEHMASSDAATLPNAEWHSFVRHARILKSTLSDIERWQLTTLVAHTDKLSPDCAGGIQPLSRRKRNLFAGLPTSPAHLEPHIPSWEAGETVAGDHFLIGSPTQIIPASPSSGDLCQGGVYVVASCRTIASACVAPSVALGQTKDRHRAGAEGFHQKCRICFGACRNK